MNSLRIILLLVFSILLSKLYAQESEINNQLPQLLGTVNSIYQKGDTLLVGGNFTKAYLKDSLIRYGGVIDTGSQVIQYPWACPDGAVTSVIGDEQGGFIVAGTFNHVGDSLRSNIVHLDSNGKVTASFSDIAVSGTVQRMQLINDTLYLAGGFKGIDKVSQTKNGSIGLLKDDTTYSAILQPESTISAAVSDGKGGWLIAGNFNAEQKIKQPTLKWIDSLGNERNWFVRTNESISSMLKVGDSLFIGGYFSSVNGVSRKHLALISIATGNVLPWNPSPNNVVHSIVSYMNKIFIGGEFNQVGDSLRGFGASFDSIGNITHWNPMAQGTIRCMVPYQKEIILGGSFYTLRNALVRKQLGAVDIDSGYATTWNPITLASNNGNAIYSLLISGPNLYVGSDFFELLNPGPGNSLRVFNLATKIEKNWNIQVRGPVYSLQSWKGKILFGGLFPEVNNQLFKNIALLDTNGNVAPFGWYAESSVELISSNGKNTLMSGSFKSFTKSPQSYFAAIRFSNSSIIPLGLDINNEVKAFVKTDSLIYLGGSFTKVNNQVRQKFVEVSLKTQQPTSFVKNFDSDIECMSIKDSIIYVGGWFYSVNDSIRKNLAAINKNTREITSWNPSADYVVSDMLLSGNDLFIGGGFGRIGNKTRMGVAKISSVNSSVSDWAPDGDLRGSNRLTFFGNKLLNGGIQPICLDTGTAEKSYLNVKYWINNYLGEYGIIPALSGRRLYLGGNFWGMGNWDIAQHQGLIAIQASTGKLLPVDFQLNGTVFDLKESYVNKNRVYIGGFFSSIKGNIRWYTADLNFSELSLGPWQPGLTSIVYALCPVFNRIYLGKSGLLDFVDHNDNGTGSSYSFSGFGGLNQPIQLANGKVYVASNSGVQTNLKVIDIGSLQTIKTYTLNGEINSIKLQDSILYLGGAFTNVSGSTRNYLAAINVKTDSVMPMFSNIEINDMVNSISVNGNRLYLAGNFTSVNGYPRKYLAMVNRVSGQLYNWTADANGTMQYVHATSGGAYVSGTFSEIRNMKRKGIAFISHMRSGTVTLVSPTSLQTNVPLNTSLTWAAIPDTGIQYQYEMDSTTSFNTPFKIIGTITQTSLKPFLRFHTNYYWRVRFIKIETDQNLITESDTSEWSVIYQFKTISFPELALPISGSLLNIDSSFFQSKPITGVKGVQLRIDTVGGNATSLFEMNTLLQTYYATVGNLIPGKQYNIAIRGYNLNDTSKWNYYLFKVNQGIVLISPNDLLDSSSVSFTFNFESGYVKQVISIFLLDTLATFNTPIIIKKTGSYNNVLQSNLRFQQKYFWKVILVRGSDTLAVSAIRTFKTDPYLLKPITPIEADTETKVVPTKITWHHLEGLFQINYQIDTNRQFSNPINRFIESALGIDSIQGLLPKYTYYIRMRGLHSGDTSDWGEVVKFKTDNKFVLPTELISPPNESLFLLTDTIHFTWKSLTSNSGYVWQITTDTNFLNSIQYITSDTFWHWSPITADTTYYWRVKALSIGKESVWSITRNFRVEMNLPVPLLLYPDSNKTVGIKTVLNWNGNSGITQYQYQLSKQPIPSNEPMVLVNKPFTDSIQLDVNSTYYWHVRSVMNSRFSNWSHIAKFNTMKSGISSLSVLNELVVYPNPVEKTLYLNNISSNIEQIIIYDLFHHKLFEINTQGKTFAEIDVSSLSTGIYIIQIRKENEVLIGRFVKE